MEFQELVDELTDENLQCLNCGSSQFNIYRSRTFLGTCNTIKGKFSRAIDDESDDFEAECQHCGFDGSKENIAENVLGEISCLLGADETMEYSKEEIKNCLFDILNIYNDKLK